MPYLPDYLAPTGYLPTTGGSIPYAVMWNAKENYYGESAGEKTPTTITVKIRVNWEDSTLFTEFARESSGERRIASVSPRTGARFRTGRRSACRPRFRAWTGL